MLASPLPCCVTLDTDLGSSYLRFPICKMVIIVVPTCSGNKMYTERYNVCCFS